VPDVAGVDQPHHQPPGSQQADERPPVVGGGLHHDPLDALAGQVLGQLAERQQVVPNLQDVRRLRRDLEPWRDTQAVRELDEQLAAARHR
jgi:hypothetical protein